ncbi:collagen alpha-1(I) chain-like [Protopterus annectens]|uniref:collagen alpha-1(I) chain-like n=1 Tax=Protopterus annectens TaxID=7888 RepID=UPI001CF96804|nr:collagen alpha-1(I) chain-like [Protopterus annectens]
MAESRSLSELTRQIAPPTKSGHAPPPTESRKSYQSVNPFRVGRAAESCRIARARRTIGGTDPRGATEPAELPPAAEGRIRSHRGFRGPALSRPVGFRALCDISSTPSGTGGGRTPSPVAGQEPSGSRGLRRVAPLRTSTWRGGGAVGTPSPRRERSRPGRSRTPSPFRTSVGGTPSGLPLLPGRESSPSRARNLPEAAGSLCVPGALGASRGTSLRSGPAPRNSPRPPRGRSALIGASAARSFPVQSSTVPVSPRSPGGCLAGPCPACPRSLPGDLAPNPAGPAELPPAAEGQIRSHRGFRGPLISDPELHGPRLPQISWRLPGRAVSRVPSEPPGGPRSDPGRPRGTPPGRRGADPLSSGLPRPRAFPSSGVPGTLRYFEHAVGYRGRSDALPPGRAGALGVPRTPAGRSLEDFHLEGGRSGPPHPCGSSPGPADLAPSLPSGLPWGGDPLRAPATTGAGELSLPG